MSKILIDLTSIARGYLPTESGKDNSPQKILTNLINWLDGIKSIHPEHEIIVISDDSKSLVDDVNPLISSFAQIIDLWTKQHSIGRLEMPQNRNIDSIYSLSKIYKNSIIISSDHRMTVALTENTSILNPLAQKKYTRNDLFDETGGLRPSDMPLFLSLTGIKEFGIEPIAGVSNSLDLTKRAEGNPAIAFEMAKSMKGFDFAQIAKSKDKLQRNLRTARVREVDVNIEALQISFDANAKSKIDGYLNQSLASSSSGSSKLPDYPVEYRTITSSSDFEWLDNVLNQVKAFSLNLERDASGVFAAVFSFREGHSVVVPFSELLGQTVDYEEVLGFLRIALEKHNKLVTFSAIDLAKGLSDIGIDKYTIKADVASGTYLLNTRNIINDASELGEQYATSIPSTIDFCKRGGAGLAVNTDQFNLFQLCSIRSDLTWKKSKEIYTAILNEGLAEQFSKYELPQSIICGKMGRRGLSIDVQGLNRYKAKIESEISSLNSRISDLYGKGVDVSVASDLVQVLDYFNIKTGSTSTGQRAINESELKKVEQEHEVIPLVMRCRTANNILSKQISKIINSTSDDGLLRFNVHTNSTSTTRLSIRDPDMQNCTAEIRGYMKPRDGYKFVSFDYSQIEIRILADLSGEQRLIDAFNSGRDVHIETAAEVFGISADKVTDEQRKAAKAINFGLIYGITPIGLAVQLGVSTQQANSYTQTYFKRLPKVLEFHQKLLKGARENGFISLISGRKIFFPEINTKNFSDKNSEERSCKNAPMQGTAAEIVKRAMVKANDMIIEEAFDANIVLQVHDELVFEVRTEQLKKFVPLAKSVLENALPMSVPLTVDVSIGQSLNKKLNNTNELNLPSLLTI